jgi:hypothetical protein
MPVVYSVDADTVIGNEARNPPQIWSIALEYVAALNTKYQEREKGFYHHFFFILEI